MNTEIANLAGRWIATYDNRYTRETYRAALAKLWEHWPAHMPRTLQAVVDATSADLQIAAAAWSEGKRPRPRTYNVTMAAWRTFYNSFLIGEGLRTREVHLKNRPRPNKPTREIPSAQDIAAVWAMLEDPALDRLAPALRHRVVIDRALFALLVAGGLRRFEVCALNVGDIDDRGEVIAAHVRGKRGKERVVGLPGSGDDGERMRGILAAAIDGRDSAEPLLVGLTGQRLGLRGCVERLAFLFEEATGKRYTPHCMRAWYATRALRANVPITVVAEQLGHTSVTTTQGYDQLRHQIVAAGCLH